MKRFSILALTAVLIFALSAFLASCGGGGGSAAVGGNTIPVANAGSDQNISTGSLVTLNGSVSTDADGNTLTYSWSFTSTPASSTATLSSATVVNPTFTADLDGAYVLSLVVNDGTASSTADTVTITASTNFAPVANAGPDQSVATTSVVTLDGSGSTDANSSNTLTYTWSFTSKPASSTAATPTATVNPTFTADKDGVYELSLVVNDGTTSSVAADTVTITAATPFPGSANFKMPDTNQTASYTVSVGEDHNYSINIPSYTDNGTTVTDNVTTLMWQKQDDNVAKTWAVAVTDCDNLTLGGHSDWRLPSRIELVSLIDNGINNPAIDPIFLGTLSVPYWSSTTNADDPNGAWYVDFSYGYAYSYDKTPTVYNARCVRGGQ